MLREAATLAPFSLLAQGSSASEIGRDGKTGLIAQNAPGSMAVSIEWAMEDPDNLLRMGEAARQSIPRAWKKAVSELLVDYKELIRNDRRRISGSALQ